MADSATNRSACNVPAAGVVNSSAAASLHADAQSMHCRRRGALRRGRGARRSAPSARTSSAAGSGSRCCPAATPSTRPASTSGCCAAPPAPCAPFCGLLMRGPWLDPSFSDVTLRFESATQEFPASPCIAWSKARHTRRNQYLTADLAAVSTQGMLRRQMWCMLLQVSAGDHTGGHHQAARKAAGTASRAAGGATWRLASRQLCRAHTAHSGQRAARGSWSAAVRSVRRNAGWW